MSRKERSTPIKCDACGRWIWIQYTGGRSRVFSAREPLGKSTRDKWILHRDENPDCPRYQ
jgi:hypothetical protein